MLFFFAPGLWVSRQIWNLEKKERLFTWCSDKIDKRTTPNVKVFVFGSVKEFSFMDSNQTVRHRFRCMYYMFSSRS